MNRRDMLAGVPLAALAAGLPGPLPQPQQQTWIEGKCPACDRKVWFLPGQKKNKCGHCGRTVRP